ncbi:hypothetical protein ZIOFF_028483 [Zingiber officinale]|uniref:Uncharacterized protein n=1 Tax=Zingiber officinale TaxID=94328 RepID=A0A8J5L3L6_ZINOF|nr:hypothetical protein ZIOFF_028483 [Zingiber officinale]
MYGLNQEEHEGDLHAPAEPITKAEVKQVQRAIHALTSRILEGQAMESQSMPCRMINFIQVGKPTILVGIGVPFNATYILDEFPRWRVDPSDGGGVDQTMIMRAMQQEFERMNVMFNEIRDRLDRHEDQLEQLQREPLPRHRRPDQRPHFAPNVPDDDYDDGASNEVVSNATWRRARAIRPKRPRHVQR